MSTTTSRRSPGRGRPLAVRSGQSAALASYTDVRGHEHRVEAHRASDGAVIVLDVSVRTGTRPLVGRFGAEEPQAAIDALVSDYVGRAELGALPVVRGVRDEDLR